LTLFSPLECSKDDKLFGICTEEGGPVQRTGGPFQILTPGNRVNNTTKTPTTSTTGGDAPPVVPTIQSIALAAAQAQCGHRPPRPINQIGLGAGKVKAPWAVSIGEYITDVFQHLCTGSILSPTLVLSAGHCITTDYFNITTHTIRAGVNNIEHSNRGQEATIRKAVFHENFQKTGKKHLYYDIALFFLQEPFLFDYATQPICLPTSAYPRLPDSKVGDALTTVGWGRDDDDQVGGGLKAIDVTIRSNDECNDKYKSTGRRDKIRIRRQLPEFFLPHQICADNNIRRDVGTCNGDSGGPSFIR
jgi:secreted trypsin-like serine protease